MPVPNVKNDDRQNALSFTNSNQFFPNNVTSWYFGNFFCDFILQRVEALCRWVWFWKSIPRDERSLLWIRLKWHAAVSAFVSLSCTETHTGIYTYNPKMEMLRIVVSTLSPRHSITKTSLNDLLVVTGKFLLLLSKFRWSTPMTSIISFIH